MRDPVQVPALMGSRPQADDNDRWDVADCSTDPDTEGERHSIVT
jgi:hypothetical protein